MPSMGARRTWVPERRECGFRVATMADKSLPRPEQQVPPQITAEPAAQGVLGTIDGMQLDLALRNVGGRLPTLVRVLTTFVHTYRHGEPDLTLPATMASVPAWRSAVHSLRGASSTLGLAGLLEALATLEHALRAPSPDDLAPLAHTLAQVNAQLVNLVELIARALPAESPDTTRTTPPAPPHAA
jgi:HPt (histidine-containing phosphotransfer) domain-containing protein